MASYRLVDDACRTGNGYSSVVALGKQMGPGPSLEMAALYDSYDAEHGSRSATLTCRQIAALFLSGPVQLLRPDRAGFRQGRGSPRPRVEIQQFPRPLWTSMTLSPGRALPPQPSQKRQPTARNPRLPQAARRVPLRHVQCTTDCRCPQPRMRSRRSGRCPTLRLVYAGLAAFDDALVLHFDAPPDSAESANADIKVRGRNGDAVSAGDGKTLARPLSGPIHLQ